MRPPVLAPPNPRLREYVPRNPTRQRTTLPREVLEAVDQLFEEVGLKEDHRERLRRYLDG